ncbi:hypothetical protein [Bacillus wiedmannii]|uniref:hypothetical protein n=1 Tax=Bacillus wiedmannii TaxID=1890302 RepID=UPI000BEF4B0E|nr:hypothetical protein [Bacillus wiedmannii]PEI67562.1 hypothetical protein CN646_17850 [Bacillus wiedmannii]PEK59933.1 hypothetical protein CN595_16595 [Bacillus wiedmannii]PEL55806.1 hypothetical protein CN622_26150 [Bacillus wiedmannii]PEO16449.1 hypothetical protein CN562_05895 [Bacillus wiedmannii]PEP05330.1 hypothetical protein CN552_28695 [Bacillus wiedmannii]
MFKKKTVNTINKIDNVLVPKNLSGEIREQSLYYIKLESYPDLYELARLSHSTKSLGSHSKLNKVEFKNIFLQ